MNPTTARRLLVYGVCAFGVGGLYLAPGLAKSPEEIGSGTPPDRRPGLPVPGTVTAVPTRLSRTLAPTTSSVPGRAVAPTADPYADDHPQELMRPGAPREAARPTSVARDLRDTDDRTPPAAVTAIRFADLTPDTMNVRWAPTRDDVGVVSYQVWLNGFQVAATSRLEARVDWFNDDTGPQVVQVRAWDAAGNESPSSASMLVNRPAIGSSPAASADVTATPTPAVSPTPSASPSSQSAMAPGATVEPSRATIAEPPSPTDTSGKAPAPGLTTTSRRQ